MNISQLSSYLDTARDLRKKFSSKIDTKIAFEVDFHKPLLSQYKRVLEPILPDLDYLIGSIHGLKWNEYIIPIDGSFPLPDELKQDKNGYDSLLLSYYDDLLDLVRSNYYDILGHFDVIKKLGFVPDNIEIVNERIFRVIDALEVRDMVVEINTSGLRKPENELYPNKQIIKELIQRNIPMILSSDAHRPEDVGYAFESTLYFLRKNGLNSIWQISSHERTRIKLD
jgi:histidinol-phosphatase (PHP family)